MRRLPVAEGQVDVGDADQGFGHELPQLGSLQGSDNGLDGSGMRRWFLLPALFAAIPASAHVASSNRDGPLILAFGDSLTAGYGLGRGLGFAPQLQDALRRNGIKARVHDAGVSGDTSAGGRARLGWTLAADGAQSPTSRSSNWAPTTCCAGSTRR